METDVNGCSTTAAGQEQYEEYYSDLARGWRVQYDYRIPEGKLFSCVAKTLEDARQRRDDWLAGQLPEDQRMHALGAPTLLGLVEPASCPGLEE
ncbi:MAG: DUF3873 family protein [Planctomycetota bacterium]|jgi:hypothetical protein